MRHECALTSPPPKPQPADQSGEAWEWCRVAVAVKLFPCRRGPRCLYRPPAGCQKTSALIPARTQRNAEGDKTRYQALPFCCVGPPPIEREPHPLARPRRQWRFFLGLSLTSPEGEEENWGALSLVFIAPEEMDRLSYDQGPPRFRPQDPCLALSTRGVRGYF